MSRLVDKDNYLLEVTRYIHRSHFHAGVRKKRDYPWSSYPIYLGRRISDLVETEPVLSQLGRGIREQRRRYRDFVEKADGNGNSYPGIVGSQIVGSRSFLERVQSQPVHQQDDGEEPPLRKAQRILREVSLSLGPNEIGDLRERRRRTLVRHVAMYLIRHQTTLPLRSIGELLGVKAAAVALAIGKIEQLLKREDFSKRLKHLLQVDFLLSSEKVGDYPAQDRELADGTALT